MSIYIVIYVNIYIYMCVCVGIYILIYMYIYVYIYIIYIYIGIPYWLFPIGLTINKSGHWACIWLQTAACNPSHVCLLGNLLPVHPVVHPKKGHHRGIGKAI